MSGLFITIEGPDGAGKTSVLEELYPRLQLEAKRDIVKTREPGGVKIAEKFGGSYWIPKILRWMNGLKHCCMLLQDANI